MNYDRLQQLAGIDGRQQKLQELAALKQQLNAQLDEAIKLTEDGEQLNEGIISSLKAAVKGTVKAGADLVSQATAKFKEVYADSRAKDQLESLRKELVVVKEKMVEAAKSAPHLMKRDEEVRDMFSGFQKQLDSLISGVETRQHFLEKTGAATTTKSTTAKPEADAAEPAAKEKPEAAAKSQPEHLDGVLAMSQHATHMTVRPGSPAAKKFKDEGWSETKLPNGDLVYTRPDSK